MTIKSLNFSKILRPNIGLIDPGSLYICSYTSYVYYMYLHVPSVLHKLAKLENGRRNHFKLCPHESHVAWLGLELATLESVIDAMPGYPRCSKANTHL